MNTEQDHDSPPSKRRKLEIDVASEAGCTPPPPTFEEATADEETAPSLQRPISPPAVRRRKSRTSGDRVQVDAHVPKESPTATAKGKKPLFPEPVEEKERNGKSYVGSPIQLTKIWGLAPHQNADTVELRDILGDPMIKECWNFNYLFDLDFLMKHFDADVKDLVKVKIVHGFWKNDDERRINLAEVAERYPNVQLISSYLPDPFGTHHSKMCILLRHDDLAQVVIHTANMIQRDWGNMTQAVWRSPLLPLQSASSTPPADDGTHAIGSGKRFKTDLLQYLNAYGKRLKALTDQLIDYDFSTIRAAFLGSVPSRQKPNAAKPSEWISFGWLGLREILSTIPIQEMASTTPPNVVVQVSSIATLGANTNWLENFKSVLNHTATPVNSVPATSFFTKASSLVKSPTNKPVPTLDIIFPTASEIRTSLDGYISGGSIHTKVQSPAQQKQLEYLRPHFCHWKHSRPDDSSQDRREAHRGPAAPHIKTYIRFTDAERKTIDWAMVTSANLSKQAWGELENKKGEVWVQSYEAGVVVWPALYREGKDSDAVMVPVFGKDLPQIGDIQGVREDGEGAGEEEERKPKIVVGFRMPYDLPLSPYGEDEVPWCATLADSEPDWMGRVWQGY